MVETNRGNETDLNRFLVLCRAFCPPLDRGSASPLTQVSHNCQIGSFRLSESAFWSTNLPLKIALRPTPFRPAGSCWRQQ